MKYDNEELKSFPTSGPIPQRPVVNNNDLKPFPTRGRIPRGGADVNAELELMNSNSNQYKLTRKAPINGSKKATVTGKNKAKALAIVAAIIAFFALATASNKAKADLYYKYLPNSSVDHVSWWDGYSAYDKNGNLITDISSEDWKEAEESFDWTDVVEEMFKNNIHQGRGGK